MQNSRIKILSTIKITGISKLGKGGVEETYIEFTRAKSYPVRKMLKMAGLEYKFIVGDLPQFVLSVCKNGGIFARIPETERKKIFEKSKNNLIKQLNECGAVPDIDYTIEVF